MPTSRFAEGRLSDRKAADYAAAGSEASQCLVREAQCDAAPRRRVFCTLSVLFGSCVRAHPASSTRMAKWSERFRTIWAAFDRTMVVYWSRKPQILGTQIEDLVGARHEHQYLHCDLHFPSVQAPSFPRVPISVC